MAIGHGHWHSWIWPFIGSFGLISLTIVEPAMGGHLATSTRGDPPSLALFIFPFFVMHVEFHLTNKGEKSMEMSLKDVEIQSSQR